MSQLAMATRDQAFDTLRSLNPAPVFLEAYRKRPLPHNLDIYFRPPEEFFLAPDSQDAYTEGRLVPILDDGNFGLVTFCDPSDGSLLMIDIESPGEVRWKFGNWQQYLGWLMIRIGESVDDDTKVRTMATCVAFESVDSLFVFFQGCARNEPIAVYDRRHREFIAELGR
jgi:hypothetical protein